MRQAFAACIAFAILVVIVVVRFGFKDSSPEPPAQSIRDAATADVPIDDAAVVLDAAPSPRKHAPKPTPKPTPTRATPKPTPTPAPVIPPPATPPPVTPPPVTPPPPRPGCTQPPNPAGCPAAEPNVNRPCDAEGVHCVYGTSCCPPVYVCNGGVFEAWFTHCP